jgi:4-amino-4-deoxy-L-arabinose transferase-like glycosyltransferase
MLNRVLRALAISSVRWLIYTGTFGLALVLLFYRLGDGSFYDWDEAIYAQVAKELLRVGPWGTITWDGYRFFHKPPLYFWLTILSYKTLGIHELGARLWAAIFGFGVVVLTFVLGVRLRSWGVGVAASLLLLVVDHAYYSQWWNFLSLSRVGTLDTPLTFWIMAALLLVWEAERRPRLLMWVGIPVGLAVLTKAWPGLLAVMIAMAYRLLARGGRPPQVGDWAIAGVVAGMVVLPWHLWQYGMHGESFLREYVAFNLVERVFRVIEENQGGPLFYLDVVRRGFSLWGYVLPLAYLWGIWRAWRKGDRGAVLLLSWVAIPLVLFSVAQTKLGWYVNMIYPALALLLAIGLADLLTDRVALGVVAVVMAVCCLRLPVPADGSPDVKQFAPQAAQVLRPDDRVYVIRPVCGGAKPSLTAGQLLATDTNIRTALVFYMDRPLTCIEERRVLEGADLRGGYLISDAESWPRIRHLGRMVLDTRQDGRGYILARAK